MSGRTAVFAGVARDCALYLSGVLANLSSFAATYDDAVFVFVVSDCRDGTADCLRHWLVATARRGTVIDLGHTEHRLRRRTERIAYARNTALDEIREHWSDRDHLVVADLDEVLSAPVPVAGFAAAARWLDAAPGHAGTFANAAPRYYDIWALRHSEWCPHDCWHPIWGRALDESFEAAKFREVFARQIAIPEILPPIAVDSAFGGLGLYRMMHTLRARYCGVDVQGRETSEHVAFNATIRRAGGQLHIYPALQVRAPRQHLYQASEFDWRWRMTMAARRAGDVVWPPWRRLTTLSRGERCRQMAG